MINKHSWTPKNKNYSYFGKPCIQRVSDYIFLILSKSKHNNLTIFVKALRTCQDVVKVSCVHCVVWLRIVFNIESLNVVGN